MSDSPFKGDLLQLDEPDEKLLDLLKPGTIFERGIPKVLADKLRWALVRYKKLGLSADESRELLLRYRNNWRKRIAIWGLDNCGAPVPDLDLRPFPNGYDDAVLEMDDACNALSHYLKGGAIDYVAADVVSVIEPQVKSKQASRNASKSRKVQERTIALEKWKEWQKDPGSYTSRSHFVSSVQNAVHNKNENGEVLEKSRKNRWYISERGVENWLKEADFLRAISKEWREKFGR
ncbi:MAG: hypothetical protein A3K04_09655 [Gallionellales bacterium RBG_16_56_9]|nr:MAG: hypothetical protein A3K04_09655 [Gallionellales bacterium RBG_16_56_9]